MGGGTPNPAANAPSPSALERVTQVTGSEDSYIAVLFAASEECVEAAGILARVVAGVP